MTRSLSLIESAKMRDLMRKSSLTEVINHALNVTLSRTLMTSGITLLVLIPLIVLGGSTIFGFALVMAIGVDLRNIVLALYRRSADAVFP